MLNVSYLQSSGERALYKVHSKKVHSPTILLPVTKGSWDSKHASFLRVGSINLSRDGTDLTMRGGTKQTLGEVFQIVTGSQKLLSKLKAKTVTLCFFPNPVVYTNTGIPSLQRFLKCYVPLFVFSVSVPNGKLRALLVKGFHVHVNVCLKWHQLDMTY